MQASQSLSPGTARLLVDVILDLTADGKLREQVAIVDLLSYFAFGFHTTAESVYIIIEVINHRALEISTFICVNIYIVYI